MYRVVLGVVATLLLVTGLAVVVFAMGLGRESDVTVFSVPVGGGSTTGKEKSTSSEWLTEYTLTERSGHKFHSKDLAGKVHVVNFFFATCPTVCRMQTSAVESLAKEFGPKGVVFLSITCDPESDTPAKLSLYADQFHADEEDWLFLTGDLPYIRRVGAEVYYLPVDKQTHSEALLVVDGKGQIRGRFSWKKPEELAEMKKMLNELLL